ncbi:hypothetical protein OA260_00230 [bacterium]|nr:hypothetical protein [bacterium]
MAIALYSKIKITGRTTGGVVAFGGIFGFITSYKACKFLNKKLTKEN